MLPSDEGGSNALALPQVSRSYSRLALASAQPRRRIIVSDHAEASMPDRTRRSKHLP